MKPWRQLGPCTEDWTGAEKGGRGRRPRLPKLFGSIPGLERLRRAWPCAICIPRTQTCRIAQYIAQKAVEEYLIPHEREIGFLSRKSNICPRGRMIHGPMRNVDGPHSNSAPSGYLLARALPACYLSHWRERIECHFRQLGLHCVSCLRFICVFLKREQHRRAAKLPRFGFPPSAAMQQQEKGERRG